MPQMFPSFVLVLSLFFIMTFFIFYLSLYWYNVGFSQTTNFSVNTKKLDILKW